MIKTSLSRKLMIVFSLILIMVVMLNIVINSQLLPKVYKEKKIEAMERLYTNIYTHYENGATNEEIVEIVKNVLSVENLRVFVWDLSDHLIIDSLPLSHEENFFFPQGDNKDKEDLRNNPQRGFPEPDDFDKRKGPFRNFHYGRNELFIFYTTPQEESIIKENESYCVFLQKSFDDLSADTFHLKGHFSNGYKVLIQMPYASIDRAVQLSNHLLFYVGIIMLIVGIIVVAITSRSIAKPIKELSGIAKSMEQLDFTRTYDHNRHDEIGKLGDSVNALSEKLKLTIDELYDKNAKLREDIELKSKIDNMRKEFIANASHELKTPVALISGYAEGLRDNVANNDETRKLYTDVIIEETEKMDNIIHQMLDLMELDGKDSPANTESFSLSDVAKIVTKDFEVLLNSRDINLEFNTRGDCTITGDYLQIYRAVSNYISNAINHVSGDRIINVNVFEDKENGKVQLSVFNTGANIPEEDLNNIWERFYKVDKAHTREYGGTGLGLSIVRSVIELHKGTYGIINHPDGVEFYFTINKENTNEI